MDKENNKLIRIFTIIGFVAVVAAIAYAVYRFFTPDYLEDFEDDFDDDFDDYFEDEESDEPDSPAEAAEYILSKLSEKHVI